jgi:HEAT repeat protein
MERMNDLLLRLKGGNMTSDGKASEVADDVIRDPQLLPKLVEGLDESDDMIRWRTAHALERISRSKPELLQEFIPRLVALASTDNVPMVKWHIAMMFANLDFSEKERDIILSTLFLLLNDESVFVKSWAIAILAIWGRRIAGRRAEIAARIKAFENSRSIAIRVRVAKALHVLENENEPIPPSWIKTREPKEPQDRE